MTAHAPRIPVLLDERRRAVEGIAALRAEEMSDVPFRAAGHDDLAFDRGPAALAARGEELVEVEVAVEAQTGVAVRGFEAGEVVFGHQVVVRDGDLETGLTCVDAREAFGALFFRLWVEGDAFEVGVALLADEAFGVETFACCAQYASGDGEGAVCAQSAQLADRGCVMRRGFWQWGGSGMTGLWPRWGWQRSLRWLSGMCWRVVDAADADTWNAWWFNVDEGRRGRGRHAARCEVWLFG